jgi:hypothetical protein
LIEEPKLNFQTECLNAYSIYSGCKREGSFVGRKIKTNILSFSLPPLSLSLSRVNETTKGAQYGFYMEKLPSS